jgi:hypothetical protein
MVVSLHYAEHHEKAVDEDVEAERGEGAARVGVVPHADLHGADQGGVEEEDSTDEQPACAHARARAHKGIVDRSHRDCARAHAQELLQHATKERVDDSITGTRTRAHARTHASKRARIMRRAYTHHRCVETTNRLATRTC